MITGIVKSVNKMIVRAGALDPHRRDMLATWLGNRRHGRDDVAAGRTLTAAMDEVEQKAADMPDRAAEIEVIQGWLEGEGGA